MTQAQPGITEALAAYALGPIGLPEAVKDIALRSLVDTVAVGIAAAKDDSVRILRKSVELPNGPSSLWFDATKTCAETAALIHGTAAHALDFDDVTLATHGHPGTVLWPTVLAIGQETGASGRAMLEAYTVGFIVCAALGRGMELMDHYGRGWHTTSTLGVFGAAAAAARLMGLDLQSTRAALGLCGSMASGSRQNFGSMTKPLHAGLAARDGIFAARACKNGFTADPAQLEGPLGFFAMYDRKAVPARALEILGDPNAAAEYGLNLKMYPCCYGAARAAAAAVALRQEHSLDLSKVERVKLTLQPHGLESLNHHRPSIGLEGKFSGEYVVAAGLHDGYVRLSSFTDEAVQRPELRRLVELVEVQESEVPPVGEEMYQRGYAVLTVTTPSDTVSKRIDLFSGDRLSPMSREQLNAKLRDCVEFSGFAVESEGLIAELWSLEEVTAFKGVRSLGS